MKIGGAVITDGTLPYDATQGDQTIDVAFPEESWIVLRPEISEPRRRLACQSGVPTVFLSRERRGAVHADDARQCKGDL